MTLGDRLRRVRWWRVYLVLLVASAAWQFLPDPAPRAHEPGGLVDVAEMTAAGPTAGRVRIAYRQWGDAHSDRVVLLLHGSPGDSDDFGHFAAALDDCRVIAPDMPGFGRSSKWVADYGIRAYARYALALLDELNIDQAHVFGFSLGSGVAINMYALQPDRLASLTIYGGIGIQEGEGTGDYDFEHFKYRVGFGLAVGVPELLPHFGLLGSRAFRVAALRNFIDTDQRPLRAVLESINHAQRKRPMLILHGAHDPLVPVWTARQHHRIVRHSELIVYDDNHFMLFDEDRAAKLGEATRRFIQRTQQPGFTPTPRTDDPFAAAEQSDNNPLRIERTMNPWLQMLLIAGGTFVSEDLTCITVGMLANRGQIDLFLGVTACFLGIFLGDIALWLAGLFIGRPVLAWKPVERWLPTHRIGALADWFDRYGLVAVFVSRFMPGTRLPLYVTAGVIGRRAWKFILWALISDLIYTPIIVLLVAALGATVADPLELWIGSTIGAAILAGIVLFILIRLAVMACSRPGRAKLRTALSRLWRYEFWPAKLFYLPMVPAMLYAHLRYRGFTTFTLCNPGLPMGGLVGESKYQILSALPGRWTIPSALVRPGDPEQRLEDARRHMTHHAWYYPLIAKPDVGQRGVGLKMIRNDDQLAACLAQQPHALLLQTYHPGPHEAGVFYIRHPDQQRGFIFSITHKTFPLIIGDGQHTLAQLIRAHPRYRFQARTFIHRHRQRADDVLAQGQTLTLAVAGNHCQGTMFSDGAHLITDALTDRIDTIARQVHGFHFGRFDVRYRDVDAFKRGDDLAIVELNGATSESTNIYDPTWSIFRAYATLHRQWLWAFEIGTANRRRLHLRPPGLRSMFAELRRHYAQRQVDEISD